MHGGLRGGVARQRRIPVAEKAHNGGILQYHGVRAGLGDGVRFLDKRVHLAVGHKGVDRDEYLCTALMAEFHRFRQGEIVKVFGVAPGVEIFRAEIYGVRAAAYRRRDSGKAARRGEDDRFCHKRSFSSARFSRRNMRRKLTVSSTHDIQIVRSPARAVIHAPAPAPRAKMPITPK